MKVEKYSKSESEKCLKLHGNRRGWLERVESRRRNPSQGGSTSREDQSHPIRLETRAEEFRFVASLSESGSVAKATGAQLRQGATSDKGVKSQV